jgi:hypothetical protein
MKILTVSGLRKMEFGRGASEDLPFLRKPYTTRTLLSRIYEVLHEADSGDIRYT